MATAKVSTIIFHFHRILDMINLSADQWLLVC